MHRWVLLYGWSDIHWEVRISVVESTISNKNHTRPTVLRWNSWTVLHQDHDLLLITVVRIVAILYIKWKIDRGSWWWSFFCTYTVQYCSADLLYMCRCAVNKTPGGPRAQEGHPSTGISRPRTEVLRTQQAHCSEAAHRAGIWTCNVWSR